MRDLDRNPYSEAEQRVARFFFDRGTGGGDDPIGAILASHQALADERNDWRQAAGVEAGLRREAMAERDRLLQPTEAMLGAMAMVLVDWLGRQPVHAMLEEAYRAAVAKRDVKP